MTKTGYTELPFLCMSHRLGMPHIPEISFKYSKGLKGVFMQGRILKKVGNPELLSLFATNCNNETHITNKYHKYIPNGQIVMG